MGKGRDLQSATSSPRPNKAQKVDTRSYFSEIPSDTVVLILGYLPVVDVVAIMSVRKVWALTGRSQMEKIVSKVAWTMFITTEYLTIKVITILGRCPKICSTEYTFMHEGVGGNTSVMIYRALMGSPTRAIAEKTLDIPPMLVNGVGDGGYVVIPVTYRTIREYLGKPSQTEMSLESYDDTDYSVEYSMDES